MISPILIQIIFWVAAIGLFVGGITRIFVESGGAAVGGLLMAIFGPLVVRIWAELMMLFFRMKETLTDIRNNTSR